VIAIDALGYLLEAVRVQEQIIGISLACGQQLLNVHFVDDLMLMPELI
jgi:hypothetical protein